MITQSLLISIILWVARSFLEGWNHPWTFYSIADNWIFLNVTLTAYFGINPCTNRNKSYVEGLTVMKIIFLGVRVCALSILTLFNMNTSTFLSGRKLYIFTDSKFWNFPRLKTPAGTFPLKFLTRAQLSSMQPICRSITVSRVSWKINCLLFMFRIYCI